MTTDGGPVEGKPMHLTTIIEEIERTRARLRSVGRSETATPDFVKKVMTVYCLKKCLSRSIC